LLVKWDEKIGPGPPPGAKKVGQQDSRTVEERGDRMIGEKQKWATVPLWAVLYGGEFSN